MKDVLEFDSIELSYGERRILFGAYMKCEVGEIVGVLGRNGSGKSSLFKVVCGSVKAQHRSVRLNGVALPADFIRRRLISYLPQDNLIPNHVTIAKAIDLFGIGKSAIVRHFPELERQLTCKPEELSGGYRRVIELMLILHSPAKFCLLDEPFSGVMPVHIESICRAMAEAASTRGIILTDHLYRNVQSAAHRLYVLANGTAYPVRNENDLIARGYLSDKSSGKF